MFHPEKNLSLHFHSPKILVFGKNEGELEVATLFQMEMWEGKVAKSWSWFCT